MQIKMFLFPLAIIFSLFLIHGCVTIKNNSSTKIQNKFIRGDYIIDNPTPRFEFIKDYSFNDEKRIYRYDSQTISKKDENTFDVWISEEHTKSNRLYYSLKRYRFSKEYYGYYIIANVELNDWGKMLNNQPNYPTSEEDYKPIVPTSIEEFIYSIIKENL